MEIDCRKTTGKALSDTRPRRNPLRCSSGRGRGSHVVIAKIVSDAVQNWNGRVLILAHIKELLEQNSGKVKAFCPEIPIGIFSAGLKSRDTEEPVIVAGIQSVYNKACELGAFDLVIVDEAHLSPS